MPLPVRQSNVWDGIKDEYVHVRERSNHGEKLNDLSEPQKPLTPEGFPLGATPDPKSSATTTEPEPGLLARELV